LKKALKCYQKWLIGIMKYHYLTKQLWLDILVWWEAGVSQYVQQAWWDSNIFLKRRIILCFYCKEDKILGWKYVMWLLTMTLNWLFPIIKMNNYFLNIEINFRFMNFTILIIYLELYKKECFSLKSLSKIFTFNFLIFN